MKKLKECGIIDARGKQYSLTERLHLIKILSKWEANLYIYGQLTWADSIRKISEKNVNIFKKIVDQCRKNDIELWVWIKPGDFRYTMHRSDRQVFIDNILRYLEIGAEGFYLLMDDLHSGDNKIRPKDSTYQAKLIDEIYQKIGNKFKAICGEHYHGCDLEEHASYWEPILETLSQEVMISWTGPGIWNKSLKKSDFEFFKRPVMLFDNYFASDTEDPLKAPTYPYDGRNPNLIETVNTAVINPNNHYAWNICAIYTAMKFWNNPNQYDPEKAFKTAIREIGDMCMDEVLRIQDLQN